MPSRVTVTLTDGRILTCTLADYPGFRTRPQSWNDAVAKFTALAAPHTPQNVRTDIVTAVHELDGITVEELTSVLAYLKVPARRGQLQSA
jgi:2-methylcitrate dehydratase